MKFSWAILSSSWYPKKQREEAKLKINRRYSSINNSGILKQEPTIRQCVNPQKGETAAWETLCSVLWRVSRTLLDDWATWAGMAVYESVRRVV